VGYLAIAKISRREEYSRMKESWNSESEDSAAGPAPITRTSIGLVAEVLGVIAQVEIFLQIDWQWIFIFSLLNKGWNLFIICCKWTLDLNICCARRLAERLPKYIHQETFRGLFCNVEANKVILRFRLYSEYESNFYLCELRPGWVCEDLSASPSIIRDFASGVRHIT
jgi:hypothetical protein